MTSAPHTLAYFEPPSSEVFTYHQKLHPQVGILSSDSEFALYDYANDARRVVFTLLVSDCTEEKIQSIKKACIKSSVIYPLDMIRYNGKDKQHLMALIYLPFKTLRCHLSVIDITQQPKLFARVLKGIISGVINLQKTERVYEINEHTLAVKEDGIGSVLLLSGKAKGGKAKGDKAKGDVSSKAKGDVDEKTADTVCCEEFKKVKNIIDGLFIDTKQKDLPDDLKTVLECMGRVKTKFHCRRLLLAPFFLDAHRKVFDYIPRIYAAVICCEEYKKALVETTFLWEASGAVTNSGLDDLIEVWDKGSQKMIWNYYDLLRFLRNAVAHISERWNELKHDGASPLLTQPWMLLKWLNLNFQEDVFNLSFLKSFPDPTDPKAKGKKTSEDSIGKIPIVDVEFRLWATSESS